MIENKTESEQAKENRNSVPILAPGIGTRISEAARKIGTRTSAAKAAGVSTDTLQRYISEDVKSPSFEPLVGLARAAGVSLEWLATGEEPLRNPVHEPPDSYSVSPSEFDKILEKVENAVIIIEEALEKQDATMSPKNKGKLAAMCVDYLYDLPVDQKPEPAKILRLMRFGS